MLFYSTGCHELEQLQELFFTVWSDLTTVTPRQCDSLSGLKQTMAELLDGVENSVWHAFDFLALEGNGTVTKSKLKVGFV